MQKCISPVFKKNERWAMMPILIRYFAFKSDISFYGLRDLSFYNSQKDV
jgi:hypothetical protein